MAQQHGSGFWLVLLFCAVAAITASAQTYTKLVTFEGTDGSDPSGLVQGTNGNLYGVASYGGISSKCTNSDGCGTVFEVMPGGQLTTLYSFCQQAHCADGETPLPGLVLATNGNFYGMTSAGGTSGGGTIFEISPTGKFISLYSFCAKSNNCPDGHGPAGTLMQAANGNLYGVTSMGGSIRTATTAAVSSFRSRWRVSTAPSTSFARLQSAVTTAEVRKLG